jgi:hypothetical protein
MGDGVGGDERRLVSRYIAPRSFRPASEFRNSRTALANERATPGARPREELRMVAHMVRLSDNQHVPADSG